VTNCLPVINEICLTTCRSAIVVSSICTLNQNLTRQPSYRCDERENPPVAACNRLTVARQDSAGQQHEAQLLINSLCLTTTAAHISLMHSGTPNVVCLRAARDAHCCQRQGRIQYAPAYHVPFCARLSATTRPMEMSYRLVSTHRFPGHRPPGHELLIAAEITVGMGRSFHIGLLRCPLSQSLDINSYPDKCDVPRGLQCCPWLG
jgi:hypothetical protein